MTFSFISFLKRLEGAQAEAQAEEKDITPTKGFWHQRKNEESESALQARFDAELAEYRVEETLVTQVAEYIFDLFDANMLKDYKTMEAFETMAIDAFHDYESTEITFEQEGLHSEFMTLFESLIGNFLEEKGKTNEEFYDMLNSYLQDRDMSDTCNAAASKESAVEVVDVIFAYTDLSVWCAAMRERAMMRAKWRKRQAESCGSSKKTQLPKTELEEAFDRTLHRSPSTSHRFDVK